MEKLKQELYYIGIKKGKVEIVGNRYIQHHDYSDIDRGVAVVHVKKKYVDLLFMGEQKTVEKSWLEECFDENTTFSFGAIYLGYDKKQLFNDFSNVLENTITHNKDKIDELIDTNEKVQSLIEKIKL